VVVIRCAYCKQEINNEELKFASVINHGEWVCKKCAYREDYLWLQSKERTYFPDFTDELDLEQFLLKSDENE